MKPISASDDATPTGRVVAAFERPASMLACGRGALRLLRMQLAGRKPREAPEFLKVASGRSDGFAAHA